MPALDLNHPQISIIIPTLNETAHIEKLIGRLRDGANGVLVEIIVADAGSNDATVATAEKCGARVVHCRQASRPVQMNLAAKLAIGDILFFVHADTLPPLDYATQIMEALQGTADFGCFRFRFDSRRAALRFNSWCTRIPLMMFRGGDQGLFIRSQLFSALGGYCENHVVMEDYDIIRRAKKLGRFTILKDDVIVSARKYESNSYPRVNLSNFTIFTLYYFGVKPIKLKHLYAKMIKHPKFDRGVN